MLAIRGMKRGSTFVVSLFACRGTDKEITTALKKPRRGPAPKVPAQGQAQKPGGFSILLQEGRAI